MATSPFSYLSFFLISVSFYGKSQANHVPALYVFGDSDLDDGNNNDQATVAKANYPPYGIDFPGGATGRFSNGFNIADYLAQFLGISLPPAIMATSEAAEKCPGGYNYASAGAGILPETGAAVGTILNLTEQVRLFRETVEGDLPRLLKIPEAISHHLSKSIFLVSIGGNDYSLNYLLPTLSNTSRLYDPEQFAELLVNQLAKHLEEIYRLGGRNFVVLEISKIGCTPFVAILQNNGTKRQCAEKQNDLVSIFNAKLATRINRLTSSLKNSIFVLVKIFHLEHLLLKHPRRYGFKDSRNPCCEMNTTVGTCVQSGRPCRHRRSHVYWDGAHRTDAASSFIAEQIFNGSTFCSPINLQNLVHQLS